MCIRREAALEVCAVAKKVLIVEDERLLSKALSDALSDRGYATETASSAEQAEELLFPSSAFDVVALDNRLPARSGVDVLRRIRSEQLRSRVVLMTAYGGNGLEGEAEALEVDAFVKKPFDLERFLDLVADLVGADGS